MTPKYNLNLAMALTIKRTSKNVFPRPEVLLPQGFLMLF